MCVHPWFTLPPQSWFIFVSAFFTTFVFYMVMGVVCGAYFGTGVRQFFTTGYNKLTSARPFQVHQLLTLNWTSYNGDFLESGYANKNRKIQNNNNNNR